MSDSELGSLGQAARTNQLKAARWIMIVVGVLSVALNGFVFVNAKSQIDKEVRQLERQGLQVDPVAVQELLFQNQIIFGVGMALGVVFIVLGVLVYQFPVPCTVLGLVLYVGAQIGFGMLAPEMLAKGLIMKIIITVALFRSVASAVAYQKEAAEDEPSAFPASTEGF